MRVRLLILSIVLSLFALLSTPISTTSTTTTAATDCATVNQVCNDIWAMVYDICITSGHRTASQCAEMEAIGRIQCKIENGCPDLPVIP